MTTRTVLRALAPRWRRIVRGFQSRAEHTAWAREVVRTRMLRPEGMGSVGSDAVPFLVDTSHELRDFAHRVAHPTPGTPGGGASAVGSGWRCVLSCLWVRLISLRASTSKQAHKATACHRLQLS